MIEKRLSGNTLKIIAIVAMTIDHLAWVVFPGYGTERWLLAVHSIGRLTAPIMCYFIAEGYHYTRDIKKYAARLFLFAVISHFAYNFAFGIPLIPFSTGDMFDQTGVIWALFLGLIALIITNTPNQKLPVWSKYILLLLCCIAAFPANWSCIAVLVVMHFGNNRGNFKKQMIGLVVFVGIYAMIYCWAIDFIYGLLQMMVILSIPLLKLYNGERGKHKGIKWFFYIYYPLHLVICGIIRVFFG